MARHSGKKGGKKRKRVASELTGRNMRVRVKSARGRKSSSTRWLDRQLNDPYVHEARKRGYRSRAAFKLLQLDERFNFLKRGQRVVDLGAAPGGWTQIVMEKTKPSESGGKLIAVDIQEMESLVGVDTLVLDICLPESSRTLRELLGAPADVILSDMAATITGHKSTDHLRTMALCEEAHTLATETLVDGGILVMKAFAGGAHADLMRSLNRDFNKLHTVKPDASRPESAETYIVATGFRSRQERDS
ncbi:MAG: Ribosomal RNA large subunit methyltransferase E [Alphaproteobacteria bacterium MarineAlpha11_Bin1]|nr:MAG: Ribosomal RNA large subunit methyltransferase E [Alphaproteobacteria bacterium MarineAlpha11_Bin1]|tara:strand:+ start:1670 stop:2410 length:741 start_codon:yes stop_codon:yes gene_type:complete